jgi:hypothetical protein
MWMPAGEMSLARGKLVVNDDDVSHKDGRPAPSSAGPDRQTPSAGSATGKCQVIMVATC